MYLPYRMIDISCSAYMQSFFVVKFYSYLIDY